MVCFSVMLGWLVDPVAPGRQWFQKRIHALSPSGSGLKYLRGDVAALLIRSVARPASNADVDAGCPALRCKLRDVASTSSCRRNSFKYRCTISLRRPARQAPVNGQSAT